MIGHGLPVYQGYASQRGYGLGNVLGGIVRAAIPFIKPIAKSAGREILLAGAKKIQRKLKQQKGVKRAVSKRKNMLRDRKIPPGKRAGSKKKSKTPRDIFA